VEQRVDSVLVEMARRWLNKFIPYRNFLSGYKIKRKWLVDLVLYRALLSFGCDPIGRDKGYKYYVYMRCNNRLVKFDTFSIVRYGGKKTKDIVASLQQLRIYNEEEVVDMLPYAGLTLFYTSSDSVTIDVYGDRSIYLMSLKDIPLYLGYISFHLSDGFSITINVETMQENRRADFVGLWYGSKSVEEGEVKYRPDFTVYAEKLLQQEGISTEEFVDMLLTKLGENYSAIVDLLRNTEDIFIKGFKGLVVMLLY
jgi:hypothetical protein